MSRRGLITIDGIDGSGKSTFARRLRDALGPQAALLSVDDFRRPVTWPADDPAGELEIYYHRRYDLQALDGCVAAFLDGAASCSFPEYDSASETLGSPRTVSFSGADWLLVEGVFVARLRSAAQAFSIYLDIPAEEAWRRVMARDTGGRVARTPEEVRRRIDRRYRPAHERYQRECSPSERAKLLVDNSDPLRPRTRRLSLDAGPAGPLTSRVTALRTALASLLPSSAPDSP